jgi:hypothetical protein
MHLRLDRSPDPSRDHDWIVLIRGVRTGGANEVCETTYSVNGTQVLKLDYAGSSLPLFQHVPLARGLLTRDTILSISVRRVLLLADGRREPLDDQDLSLHVSAMQIVDIAAHFRSCAAASQLAFAVSGADLTLPMLGVGWQPPDKAGVQAIGDRQTLRIPGFPVPPSRFLVLGFNELQAEIASKLSIRLGGRSVNHQLLPADASPGSCADRRRAEAWIDLRPPEGANPSADSAQALEILVPGGPADCRPYHLATAAFSDHDGRGR